MVVSPAQDIPFPATAAAAGVLLGKTELVRDLVFGSERAQFVPSRVLDLEAGLATLLLAQMFDLAWIKHAGRPFGRRCRFKIERELGNFLFEILQWPERGDIEHGHEAAVIVPAGRLD